MTAYVIVSMIFLFLLGLVWSRDNWFNIFLKITMIGVSVWGLVLTLELLGYIVKA